ncbi:hypothetical protein FRC15_005831, partial [Serendipita sp. 397]
MQLIDSFSSASGMLVELLQNPAFLSFRMIPTSPVQLHFQVTRSVSRTIGAHSGPGEASSISSSTSSTLSTSSILSSTTLPPSSSAPTSASTTTRTGAQTSSTTSQGTGGSSHQFPIHIIIPIAVSIFIVTFIIVFYIRRRTLRGTFVEFTINAEPDVRMSNLGREHTDEFAQSRGPSPRSSLQSSRHVGRVGGGFEYYTENSDSSSTPGIHSPPI